MICGTTVYVADAGQYRTCTVPDVHPNHDMPGVDNEVHSPHVSGDYIWFTTYDVIGPVEYYADNACWACGEPFPEYQKENIIPFKASPEDLECGEVYRCTKCQKEWSTIECRKEYTT